MPNPQQLNPHFLGVIDLAQPSYVLAVLAAGVQFIQARQLLKTTSPAALKPPPEVAGNKAAEDESMAAMMNKQLAYTMPIVTIIIGIKLPGGLTLYWFVMSALTVLQQAWYLKRLPPKMEPQL